VESIKKQEIGFTVKSSGPELGMSDTTLNDWKPGTRNEVNGRKTNERNKS